MTPIEDIRVIIFDLDGTLAPFNRPAAHETVCALRELESSGKIIGVCSGKPLAYLCGWMRQIGLKDPAILGENGSDIQFGVVFPPEKHLRLPCPPGCREKLAAIRAEINARIPGIWYQPNSMVLTPFFADDRQRETLRQIIFSRVVPGDGIRVYEHPDCFDLVPEGISKREGILALSRLLSIPADQFAAVGDGVNDSPMFEAAGLSIGICLPDPSLVDINAGSIGEALALLKV